MFHFLYMILQAILEGTESYHNFITTFLLKQFITIDQVPQWALDALRHAEIDV